jgi:hypothetical protein
MQELIFKSCPFGGLCIFPEGISNECEHEIKLCANFGNQEQRERWDELPNLYLLTLKSTTLAFKNEMHLHFFLSDFPEWKEAQRQDMSQKPSHTMRSRLVSRYRRELETFATMIERELEAINDPKDGQVSSSIGRIATEIARMNAEIKNIDNYIKVYEEENK